MGEERVIAFQTRLPIETASPAADPRSHACRGPSRRGRRRDQPRGRDPRGRTVGRRAGEGRRPRTQAGRAGRAGGCPAGQTAAQSRPGSCRRSRHCHPCAAGCRRDQARPEDPAGAREGRRRRDDRRGDGQDPRLRPRKGEIRRLRRHRGDRRWLAGSARGTDHG